MLPGYRNGFRPYFSPVFVTRVTPKKTGTGVLSLAFMNAMYAQGVQSFDLYLKILER